MSNWVQKDAAELLSISPRVMNYKIKTLRIEFPRGRRLQPVDVEPIARAERPAFDSFNQPLEARSEPTTYIM